MRIDLEGGKFTYLFDEETGRQEALRYNEAWRPLTGDGFVLAMAQEIMRLKRALSTQSQVVAAAQQWWMSRRPLGWSEDQHRSNPEVNCTEGGAAPFLAMAVVGWLNSGDEFAVPPPFTEGPQAAPPDKPAPSAKTVGVAWEKPCIDPATLTEVLGVPIAHLSSVLTELYTASGRPAVQILEDLYRCKGHLQMLQMWARGILGGAFPGVVLHTEGTEGTKVREVLKQLASA